MWASMAAWLRDSDNRDILKLLGAAFAFVWTTLWGVYIWRYPRQQNTEDSFGKVPAHLRPYNQRRRPLREVAGSGLMIWAAGVVVFVGVGFVLEPTKVIRPVADSAPPPALRVCSSESVENCPAHNVFIGCEPIHYWAETACKGSYNVRVTTAIKNKDSFLFRFSRQNHCDTVFYLVRCTEGH
jgi:hypothetical protein